MKNKRYSIIKNLDSFKVDTKSIVEILTHYKIKKFMKIINFKYINKAKKWN
jgi:hypothetical protein